MVVRAPDWQWVAVDSQRELLARVRQFLLTSVANDRLTGVSGAPLRSSSRTWHRTPPP
jgi:hypothetical protein